jgi:hypothetical protein
MNHILSIEALLIAVILIIYILASHIIQVKEIPYIHESSLAILLGLLLQLFTLEVKTHIKVFF